MSFNSKAYLAYEERLLEPDSVIITGRFKRDKKYPDYKFPKLPPKLSEKEHDRLQDLYLKSKGIIILCIVLLSSCTPVKHLHQGRYTYKQIQRAGYTCEPFKGTHYIRPTADSLKVNIKKL